MGKPDIQRLNTFEQIKLLADARRLSILRHLMGGPASLTQLGFALGKHPAWVRHHLVRLEQAGLVENAGEKTIAGATEKFYQAKAGAFILQEMILPENTILPTVIFSGSHDLAVEALARQLESHLNVMVMPVGSLDGLVMLRQGFCHLSGCHLLDVNGEYNLPFVQHFFPDREMQVVTLAHREQGLMLFPGNPKQIRGLPDLVRPGIEFINRQKGSGTRLWLDQEIQRLGLPTEKISGYDREVRLHTECARIVQSGKVDAAIGLCAAASQAGLDFIPLFQERYDIVIPREQVSSVTPLLEILQTSAFRRNMADLNGYDTSHTGDQIPL
jgi:putative molybdopterin biosynthesis protein